MTTHNNDTSNKSEAETQPVAASASAPALELKPLKNVIPIIPAQQVDSSYPSSSEASPQIPGSPNTGLALDPDNDETGVENITQVHPSFRRARTHARSIPFSTSTNNMSSLVLCSSLPHSKKYAGRIREDPVGFVVQTAAFYQGTVCSEQLIHYGCQANDTATVARTTLCWIADRQRTAVDCHRELIIVIFSH